MNGFGSSRRLVGRFHFTGRKNRFGLKLREAKKNSFLFDRASADIFHASVLALKQYIISPLEMTSNIMLIWAVFL